MSERRCATVLGIVGIVAEGVAMLAVLLLWIALTELKNALAGAELVAEMQLG
jgi:hypothetical protein